MASPLLLFLVNISMIFFTKPLFWNSVQHTHIKIPLPFTSIARSQAWATVTAASLPICFTSRLTARDITDWASPNGNVIIPIIHTPKTQLPKDYKHNKYINKTRHTYTVRIWTTSAFFNFLVLKSWHRMVLCCEVSSVVCVRVCVRACWGWGWGVGGISLTALWTIGLLRCDRYGKLLSRRKLGKSL